MLQVFDLLPRNVCIKGRVSHGGEILDVVCYVWLGVWRVGRIESFRRMEKILIILQVVW